LEGAGKRLAREASGKDSTKRVSAPALKKIATCAMQRAMEPRILLEEGKHGRKRIRNCSETRKGKRKQPGSGDRGGPARGRGRARGRRERETSMGRGTHPRLICGYCTAKF